MIIPVVLLVEVSVVVLTDVSVVVVGVGFIGPSEFNKHRKTPVQANTQTTVSINCLIANVVVIPEESWSVSDSAPNPASLKAAT